MSVVLPIEKIKLVLMLLSFLLFPAGWVSADVIGENVKIIEDLTGQIRKHQLPDGAIRMSQNGNQVWICPYFSNISCLAALHAGRNDRVSNRPAIEMASKWVKWYVENQKEDGTIDDFGGNVTSYKSLNKRDSTDSYAATFLMLGDALWQTGEAAGMKDILIKGMTKALAAIELTIDTDGKSWASPEYKAKYLMDNLEVNAGLAAAKHFFGAVGEQELAVKSAAMEGKNTRALLKYYIPEQNCFAWAETDGVIHKGFKAKYPEVMANLFAAAMIEGLPPSFWKKLKDEHYKILTEGNIPWMVIGGAYKFNDMELAGKIRKTAAANSRELEKLSLDKLNSLLILLADDGHFCPVIKVPGLSKFPGSKGLITGTFLLTRDGHYGDLKWTRKHLLMMKDVGLDTVIITWIGHKSPPDDKNAPIYAYYNSKLLKPFSGITAKTDPIANIFQAADELDMNAIIAVEPLNSGDSRQDLERDKEVSSEIWNMFGYHKSFYGWYFSNEYSDAFWRDANFRKTLGVYYKNMVNHLHEISGKTVSIAPYFSDKGPEEEAAIWGTACDTAGFDLIMLQDGIGCTPQRVTLDKIPGYYKAIAEACKKRNTAFWCDLEAFAMDPKNVYKLDPADFDRVKKQIDAVKDHVEKIVIWQFDVNMAPPEASVCRSDAGKELYEKYRRYYQETTGRSPDLEIPPASVSVSKSEDGRTYRLNMTVRNQGNHQIGQNIELVLYDGAPGESLPFVERTIPWLPAGASARLSFELPADKLKSGTLGIAADPDGKIYEADRKNNMVTYKL